MKKTNLYLIFVSFLLALPAMANPVPQIEIDTFAYVNSPNVSGSQSVGEFLLETDTSLFPLKLYKTVDEIQNMVNNPSHAEYMSFEMLNTGSSTQLFKATYHDKRSGGLADTCAFYIIENGVSVGYAVVEPLLTSDVLPEFTSIVSLPMINPEFFKKDQQVSKYLFFKQGKSQSKVNQQKSFYLYQPPVVQNYLEQYGHLKSSDMNLIVYRGFFRKENEALIYQYIAPYLKDIIIKY